MIVCVIEMHVHDQVLGHNLAQSLHVETRLVYRPIVELMCGSDSYHYTWLLTLFPGHSYLQCALECGMSGDVAGAVSLTLTQTNRMKRKSHVPMRS